MDSSDTDRAFKGSIPELYERLMVPMVFEPYAVDVARRVAAREPVRVLETAAGTGVVTRELARVLAPDVEVVATDLNQPMLDTAAEIWAAEVGVARSVTWQHADSAHLPFEDASFDVVVCQFGVMFFPDKTAAHAEAYRVLRPGGTLVFNVWDRIEDNEFAHHTQQALCDAFPDDPPLFMERIPHGYFDRVTILADVAHGGFTAEPTFETVSQRRLVASARVPAVALCQGTPWNHELQDRATTSGLTVAEMTDLAEAALAGRFGDGPIEGKVQAHVVTVTR
jgi:SAM-dependent methyltransferase